MSEADKSIAKMQEKVDWMMENLKLYWEAQKNVELAMEADCSMNHYYRERTKYYCNSIKTWDQISNIILSLDH